MSEYDGPVYQRKENRKREFGAKVTKYRLRDRHAVGKSEFETAWQGKSKQWSDKKIRLTDKLNTLPELAEDKEQQGTSRETYKIPYLERQATKLPHFEMMQEEVASNETEVESSPRQVYEASYQKKLAEELEDQTFKARVLPKPYRNPQSQQAEMANLKEIKQRLRKAKDSFILFDDQEANERWS